MDKAQNARPHGLTLEGRRRAVITGVNELTSFNEQMVVLMTSEGALTLLGEGLHIEQLSLEDGRLDVTGEIAAIEYSAPTRKRRALFGKRAKP